MIFNNQDVFKEMDAMMNRLMAEMEESSSFFEPRVTGYRIIIDGVPVSPEGNNAGPVQAQDADEPVPEVHRIGDDVYVIASLPGVSEENLNLQLTGNDLAIDASSSLRTYHATAALPPIDPAPMKHSLKNGVLEVSFRALQDTAATGKTAKPEKTS
ncbi:MAG: hypothetical protein LUQ31_02290 [Methanoregula sp.]|nr:hypothetical protein [Methanoregula sp.]